MLDGLGYEGVVIAEAYGKEWDITFSLGVMKIEEKVEA